MPGIPSKSSAEGRGQNNAPVELVLRSRQEFLAGYDATLPHGGVFCPTRRKAIKGAPATVKVNLGRRQPPLVIAGRVVWRRPGRHLQKIRAGHLRRVLAQREGQDRLPAGPGEGGRSGAQPPAARAAAGRDPGQLAPARARRAPARGMLRDIGRGGAFVRSSSPVPSDAEVVLELSPPGAQVAMEFTARVAWTAGAGTEARLRRRVARARRRRRQTHPRAGPPADRSRQRALSADLAAAPALGARLSS